MTNERKKILEMLSERKITADEADRLLSAILRNNGSDSDNAGHKEPKYLRIMVEPGPKSKSPDKVNIRVPLKLIRAGLKLAALIPKSAQTQVNDALHEKGIEMDFSQIKPEDLENIVKQLDDLTVDVEGKESVRIFCE
jgi:SHOCT-like protein